jgi:hypothetical protein
VSVELPAYPLYPHDALTPDPKLLDELARAYGRDDVVEFLFGFAPARLFERVLGEATAQLPGPSLIWIMHLSGYFGGQWLRAELRRAQPDGMLAKTGIPPTRDSFQATADRAGAALEASTASDAAALAYAEESLPELVAGFGYNQGYLQQIVEAPPAGLRAADGFVVPSGLLWCEYGRPRLAALAGLREVSRRLASDGGAAWRRLGDPLPETLDAEVARGRQVWSTGLSVDGFSQRSYEQLLDVSGSFLEIIQAASLITAQALAEGDGDRARRAALAHACILPWLGSYASGLMDPGADALKEAPLPSLNQ